MTRLDVRCCAVGVDQVRPRSLRDNVIPNTPLPAWSYRVISLRLGLFPHGGAAIVDSGPHQAWNLKTNAEPENDKETKETGRTLRGLTGDSKIPTQTGQVGP